MFPATTQTMRAIGARVRSDLGRLIAVVMCVVVLLVPLHSAFEGNQLSSSTGSFESSDLPGGSQEPDGPGRQHGAHCPCGVVAGGLDAAISFPRPHAALRFTPGPSGNQIVAAPPTPPPPRS